MHLNSKIIGSLKRTLKAYIFRQATSVQSVNYLWRRIYPECVSYLKYVKLSETVPGPAGLQNHACRRVGGQRVTAYQALFQPPLPEPCVTLSMSQGAPVDRPCGTG